MQGEIRMFPSNKLVSLFTMVLLMFGVPMISQAQTLTKMSAEFTQTNDDKDWNTQVQIFVVCNNHTVASRKCCSSDHNGDHWNDPGNPKTVPLDVVEHPIKQDLNACSFKVGAQAHGHDIWQFTSKLHAEFSDGSVREWNFPADSLDSKHSQLVFTKEYPLAQYPNPRKKNP